MTPLQRKDVKFILWGQFAIKVTNEQRRAGEFWITRRVKELLLLLVADCGLSLDTAREVLKEFIRERECVLQPASFSVMCFTNMEGRRGEDRIAKWALKNDHAYCPDVRMHSSHLLGENPYGPFGSWS